MAGEGGFSNACKALVSPPPLNQSREVVDTLRQKHPPSDKQIDLSSVGNPSSDLVPLADVALVEQM